MVFSEISSLTLKRNFSQPPRGKHACAHHQNEAVHNLMENRHGLHQRPPRRAGWRALLPQTSPPHPGFHPENRPREAWRIFRTYPCRLPLIPGPGSEHGDNQKVTPQFLPVIQSLFSWGCSENSTLVRATHSIPLWICVHSETGVLQKTCAENRRNWR